MVKENELRRRQLLTEHEEEIEEFKHTKHKLERQVGPNFRWPISSLCSAWHTFDEPVASNLPNVMFWINFFTSHKQGNTTFSVLYAEIWVF